MAAPAHAATAPVLTSPDGGASLVEGRSAEFTWTGSLQGDPAAVSRSYFRVELAPAASVPSDPQAEWTTLTDSRITSSGEQTNSMDMGVPEAGSYLWRVCAWGVVDASADNTLEQFAGGCSTSRALTTTAAVETVGETALLTVPGATTTVEGAILRETRVRPNSGKEVVKPAPNLVRTLPVPRAERARVAQEITEPKFGQEGNGSSMHLPNNGTSNLNGSKDDASGGAYGVLSRGLSATLPFVPIPYWALALLLAALPLTRIWRSTTLNMFEWPDEVDSGPLDSSSIEGLKAPQVAADGAIDRTASSPIRAAA